ncbi:MAG TPA: UDP-2,3-diacylglucosamine diphosphatase [Bacteroidales bacterium]|nr:UDP-2,3-diacylglucosamine diphosphatase [Bacteroidales bacterium]
MTVANHKIYFVSDCHFGIPDHHRSLVREKKFIEWLAMAQTDASEIYILGDLFDFWFEYKNVIPKGYTRLLGKLAELTDSGIKVHLFTGNHDMWMFDYFSRELGIDITRKPVVKEINGLTMMIGHGDGLGPGDHGYKMIKKIFASKICQWLFARLHPNFAIGLGLYFSTRSRLARGDNDLIYLGEEGERLIAYAKEKIKTEHYDLFVFGHRHLPIDLKIAENSRYINLGDWLVHFSYAELDGKNFLLKNF